MAEYTEDAGVWPQLVAIHGAVTRELEARELGVQVTFIPGAINAILQDAATGCAEGFIRVAGVFPYTSFPEVDTTSNCSTLTGATIEVGVMRCMPAADPRLPQNGPGFAETFETTRQQLADMRAIQCALQKVDIEDIALGQYTPVGPQGTAVGGYWTVSIGAV
jgi:hypothetical protein